VGTVLVVVLGCGLLEPAVSFTVTTDRAGIDTVAAPPDKLTEVVANVFPWFVSQAEAAPGVKPAKDVLADCVDPPLLVKTTTTEPSVFWKAPMITLEIEPVVATR
jgi:hypothetical protein